MSESTATGSVPDENVVRQSAELKIKSVRGWITPLVADLADACHHIPWWIGSRTEAQEMFNDPEYTSTRARRVDWIVTLGTLTLSLLYWIVVSNWSTEDETVRFLVHKFTIILSAAILINVMATSFRIALFDAWFNKLHVRPRVASHPRIIVLGLINFLQIMLAFSVFYATDPKHIAIPDGIELDWIDPLYLSCMTQMTIGYGDRHPEGNLRLVVMLQSLCVTSFLVVFFARAVGTLPPITSIEDRMRRKLRKDLKRLRTEKLARSMSESAVESQKEKTP